MTIFKTILQILKKNKGNLIVGVIVTMFITMFYALDLASNNEELSGAKISIVSKDHSKVEKELIDYLSKHHTIVKLKDNSERTMDDALYFEKIDYILEIPQNFSEKLNEGKVVKLKSKTRPATFSKSLVDSTVNNFLNTYLTYQKQMPELNESTILKQTRKTIEKKGKIQFDNTYHKKRERSLIGKIYNLLAYGLFISIFGGYAAVNLSFNKDEIYRRNKCSPFSRRKLSNYIFLGNLIYAIFCWVLFVGFVVGITKGGINQFTGFFVLNALLFFVTILTFSILVTSLIQSEDAISGINSIFIMGSCFIGGIFVPDEYLPAVVSKVATFTPTYWFAQNNELIGKTIVFDKTFFNEFIKQTGIMLSFACIFWIIHLVSMREKESLT